MVVLRRGRRGVGQDVAGGLGRVVRGEGRTRVADVDHVVRDVDLLARGERLVGRQPVVVGDQVPEAGVAPELLRDRLQRVAGQDRVRLRGGFDVGRIELGVVLVEVGRRCRCRRAADRLADGGGEGGLARPGVADRADRVVVQVVVLVDRTGRVGAVHHLARHVVDVGDGVWLPVVDAGRGQVAVGVVTERGGVDRAAASVRVELDLALLGEGPPDEAVGVPVVGLVGAAAAARDNVGRRRNAGELAGFVDPAPDAAGRRRVVVIGVGLIEYRTVGLCLVALVRSHLAVIVVEYIVPAVRYSAR